MIAILTLGLLMLLSDAANADRKEISVWADISVSASGVVEEVKVVVPALSQEIAAPIEATIATWTFAPGIAREQRVGRTTSVRVLLRRSMSDADGTGGIQAEKLEEGPRILQPAHDACLESISGAAPLLSFTVTAEGRAVEISGSDPESESERCAIKIIQGTLFKADTVNGKPVSTSVSRKMQFK